MSFNSVNNQLPQSDKGHRLYKGVVVDNADPLHLDRIKVKIPNLFDNELSEIPWIFPIKHSAFGQGSNLGQFGVPAIGSIVVVELQGDDPNFAYYSGYLLTSTNTIQDLQPGQYRTIDPSGSVLNIDTINNVFDYSHVSGVVIRIEQGSIFITANQHVNMQVKGDTSITTQGQTDISSQGNVNINSQGQTSIVASGNINTECSTFDVKASSMNVHCPIHCVSISTTYGSGGVGATITGGIKNTGGQIESNGIVLETHVHTGVEPGGGNTGGPK